MRDKEFARLENHFIYILTGIITVIAGVLHKGGFNKGQWLVIAYYIITILVEGHIYKKKNVSNALHGKLCIVLMIIAAIILGVELENTGIYLFCLMIPAFVLVIYTDYKLIYFLGVAVIAHLSVLWLLDFPGMSGSIEVIEMLLFYVGYIIICWMLILFAKKLEFKERQAYEQERSLDDMLKVVSAKCDEAREATKSKSMFLSNMSHEIRTPLNAILGMNEMILRDSNDQEVIENATNIESSGRMLLSLINDILDFSKIEAGKMELVNVEYQVASVLNDLINMVKPRVEEKNLNLKLEINSGMPSILYGDEVRIKQITTNLLTNAVKYTEKGSIKLIVDFVYVNDGEIELYIGVKDTGIGISKEDQDKLFKSFQRVSIETNRNIEGTGLGLAITKRFVDMMDGNINVESEQGKGSLFYVKIKQKIVSMEPIGNVQQNFHPVEKVCVSKTLFEAPDARILVVDDNEMNLQVVKGLLRYTKMHIDTATSGKDCIEKVKNNIYHIVFLDHMMPEMDGIETLSYLKSAHLADDVVIIALTANAVSGAREMYFKHGFNDYLSKPISGTNLEKMVIRWLPAQLLKKPSDSEINITEEANLKDVKIEFPECMNEEIALQYSADGVDGVIYNVQLFINNTPDTKSKLHKAYKVKDWKTYQIVVHALGSTSETIGVSELSDNARMLEKAAKEEDTGYINVHHKELMKVYDETVIELKGMVKDSLPNVETNANMEVVDISKEELVKLIDELSQAIMDYDSTLIREYINQLKVVNLPKEELKTSVDRLTIYADEYEYEKLGEIVLMMKDEI